mmetsp:Transcript_8150/g.14747  ORF Transcript_8150/g.14747 Transcript_8150/m.14747 type:complete len:80 (-) Transcript_8150:914-1153(-)
MNVIPFLLLVSTFENLIDKLRSDDFKGEGDELLDALLGSEFVSEFLGDDDDDDLSLCMAHVSGTWNAQSNMGFKASYPG